MRTTRPETGCQGERGRVTFDLLDRNLPPERRVLERERVLPEEHRPDALIVDAAIPPRGGFLFAAQAHALPGCLDIPILLTAAAGTYDPQLLEKARRDCGVRDLLQQWDGEALRAFLLSTHYRHPINFTESAIADADRRALGRPGRHPAGPRGPVRHRWISPGPLSS